MKKSITSINPKAKNATVKTDKRIYLIYLQFFLTIIIIVAAVMTIFHRELFPALQLMLGITLVVMGINNRFTYRRKYFTLIYCIIGIGLMVLFILARLGIGA